MNNFETTINTLSQLGNKIYKGHWADIIQLEDEDDRYTIAIEKAISAIKVLEQIRWERDVAVAQINELGLSFGERIDGVYLPNNLYDELLEYKYRYENLCK